MAWIRFSARGLPNSQLPINRHIFPCPVTPVLLGGYFGRAATRSPCYPSFTHNFLGSCGGGTIVPGYRRGNDGCTARTNTCGVFSSGICRCSPSRRLHLLFCLCRKLSSRSDVRGDRRWASRPRDPPGRNCSPPVAAAGASSLFPAKDRYTIQSAVEPRSESVQLQHERCLEISVALLLPLYPRVVCFFLTRNNVGMSGRTLQRVLIRRRLGGSRVSSLRLSWVFCGA